MRANGDSVDFSEAKPREIVAVNTATYLSVRMTTYEPIPNADEQLPQRKERSKCSFRVLTALFAVAFGISALLFYLPSSSILSQNPTSDTTEPITDTPMPMTPVPQGKKSIG